MTLTHRLSGPYHLVICLSLRGVMAEGYLARRAVPPGIAFSVDHIGAEQSGI